METKTNALEVKTGEGIGDTNGLSWSIMYQSIVSEQVFRISDKEKEILRELGKKVSELASLPVQKEKEELWKLHHRLGRTRPIIFCDPEGAWYEIIKAEMLLCENHLARVWEFKLRKEIYWAEHIKDDRVVEPSFSVHYISTKSSRGREMKTIGGKDGGSYNWEAPFKDGYDNLNKLLPSVIHVDLKRTHELENLAHEVFDGILEVKLEGVWWWSLGMTTDLIFLRGFENILFDFYDNPDKVHKLMSFLRDENIAMLDYLTENNLLTLNNGGDFHGTGGYGWTDELPGTGYDGKKVRTLDMWGFCESQETSGVSPGIFEEFIFPYQLEMLKKFGLNIYGCCEPLDQRWDVVKRIPRLRKVTVSPWSKDEKMAEFLENNYVYCKKVNPARISTLIVDEDEVRKELRTTFEATKRHDCRVEILMRDLMTLGDNPKNAGRWVEIAREESER